MRGRRLLLRVYGALLLCHYGMFTTAPPLEATSLDDEILSDSTAILTASPSQDGSDDNQVTGDQVTKATRGDDQVTNQRLEEEAVENHHNDTHNTATSAAAAITTTVATTNASTIGKDIGIAIVVFILLLSGTLLLVLFGLHRSSKRCSFDLRHVWPMDDSEMPLQAMTRRPVSYQPAHQAAEVCAEGDKAGPLANGHSPEEPEQTSDDHMTDSPRVPEEDSITSISSLTPPLVKKVEFILDLDVIKAESDLNQSTEASDQGENQNNNVSDAGRKAADEIFTEVNLEMKETEDEFVSFSQ